MATYVAWLAATGISKGLTFRAVDRHGRIELSLSARAVAQIVQRRAALAGSMGPVFRALVKAGFAMPSRHAGREERITRHCSAAVVRHYIRDGELPHDLAAEVGP